MKHQPPVLIVKALRERRAQLAAQLARMELQQRRREEEDCRSNWQRACARSLAQHEALGRFVGGADELLAAEAQWQASLAAQGRALRAWRQAADRSAAARLRQQERSRAWAVASEAFRQAAQQVWRQRLKAEELRLGREEEDVAETRAVVQKVMGRHAEV